MLFWIIKIILTPFAWLYFRPWSRNNKVVPRDGAAILASNHLAVMDSVVLPLILPRQVKFIAKSDYFTGRGFKGWLTRNFMKMVGAFPVDRRGGKASQRALESSLRVLEEGNLFGIYPEGTRSPDGKLYKGRTGVARIAIESGAPVIPVVMVGTRQAQKPGAPFPKPARCGAIFGEPLYFGHYKNSEVTHEILRQVTDEIMEAIAALSEQEYVSDTYASVAKARIADHGESLEQTVDEKAVEENIAEGTVENTAPTASTNQ